MSELLYSRDFYGKALVDLGRERKDIVVLDADLSGSTRTAKFRDEFPDRFFNIGVAEQNLMGISAGLASCGFTVFASSFAIFATGRPWDQIRNTICANHLNVKIVATHAGITVGEDGASHQANEDIAIMRAIPNMRVISPCDAFETYEVIKAIADIPGPFYVRMGRSKSPVVEERAHHFQFGKGQILRDGKDCFLFAHGLMVYNSLRAAEHLEKEKISVGVVNMPTIKPLDEELVLDIASKVKKIAVCEEHSVIGGLGSAISELLSQKQPVKMTLIGIGDVFGQSGSPDELLKAYGLDIDSIVSKVRDLVRNT